MNKHSLPLLFVALFALDNYCPAQSDRNIRTGPLILREAYAKAHNTDPGDALGWSVAVDGDVMVVGAPREDSDATGVNGDGNNNNVFNSGAAYVYHRDVATGEWTFEAYLKPESTNQVGSFGESVAVSGNLIVVGAPRNGVGGEAVVYRRNGNTWVLEETLTGNVTEAGDMFGQSVAIDGGVIIVGAPNEDGGFGGVGGDESDNSRGDSGSAYAFTRDNQGWQQEAYIKSTSPDAGDQFGWSVAISQNAMVAGMPGDASSSTGVNGDPFDNNMSNSGCAFVYQRITGGVWSLNAFLKASNTDIDDAFGTSVAIAGDTVIVGAPGEDSDSIGYNGADNNLAVNSGAAYVFYRPTSTWQHHAYLKAMNTAAGYSFGQSVSIFGDLVAIGAPDDDSPSYGVNGDSSTRIGAMIYSGSVQTYARELGLWLPFAYFKSPSPDEWDFFGHSVSVSNGLLVAGAWGEDGAGTGINGNFFNEGALGAGAAFCMNVAPDYGLSRYGTYSGPNYADLYSYGIPRGGEFMHFQLSGFANSGPAALVLSRQPDWVPRDGGVIHLDLSPALLLLPGGYEWVPVSPINANPLNCGGSYEVFFPAAAAGFTLYGQAAKHDPTLPGLALSNGLMVVVGP